MKGLIIHPREAMVVFVVTLLVGSTGCAARSRTSSIVDDQMSARWTRITAEERAILIVANTKTGEVWCNDVERARERFAPCSTFKIPHALIALETGVLSGRDHQFAWDGHERSRSVTNRYHKLATAVQHSVVWYFQEVARRIGPARMRNWLAHLAYGNEDISGGIDRFWLSSSLMISPEEQVEFLGRLAHQELDVSEASQRLVRELIRLEHRDGIALFGKTGTGGESADAPNLGWFVGWLEDEHTQPTIIFAVVTPADGATGRSARELTESLLIDAGWWSPAPAVAAD